MVRPARAGLPRLASLADEPGHASPLTGCGRGAGGFGLLLLSAGACGSVPVSRSARPAAGCAWLRGFGDGPRAASPPASASGSPVLAGAAVCGSRGLATSAVRSAAGCVPAPCPAAGAARGVPGRAGADGHARSGACSHSCAVAAGRPVSRVSGAAVSYPGTGRAGRAAGRGGQAAVPQGPQPGASAEPTSRSGRRMQSASRWWAISMAGTPIRTP